MDRRTAMGTLAALGAGSFSIATRAQSGYPTKPVRIVVGVAPGGSTDMVARLYAQKLTERLKQSFIVENRPGASGTLAADLVARAAGDGYTLFVTAPTVTVVAPLLYRNLAFDPARDFTPVTLLGGGPLALAVHTETGVTQVSELLDLAKSRPGKIAFGSGGKGTASHLSAELFATMAGVQLLHVPYKGDGQAVTDLVGGQVQLMFTGYNLLEPHIKSGRIKLLALTSAQRYAGMPQIPTVAESGVKGYEALGWNGLFAPSSTPAPIVELIARACHAIRSDPDMKARLRAMTFDGLQTETPAAFAALHRAEEARWKGVIQAANIQPE